MSYRTFDFSPDPNNWLKDAMISERFKATDIELKNLKEGAHVVGYPGNFAEVTNSTCYMSKKLDVSNERRSPAARDPIIQFDVPSSLMKLSSVDQISNVLRTSSGKDRNMSLGLLTGDIQISTKRIGYFSITPGKWFNPLAIQYFKSGPWVKGPVADGTLRLWGKDGALSAIPMGVVIAYGLTASIKAKPDCFKDVIERAQVVHVGPFAFNPLDGIDLSPCILLPDLPQCRRKKELKPSEPTSKVPTTNDPATNTITIGSPHSAQIIAVNVAIMPDL